MLGSMMIVAAFLFVTFGLVAVPLWKGVLRGRCVTVKGSIYVPYDGGSYVCSMADAGETQSLTWPHALGLAWVGEGARFSAGG